MATTSISHRNNSNNKTRTLVRSDSSRRSGSLFGKIDETISRTFSLSSLEGEEEDIEDRSVQTTTTQIFEGFSDEGTARTHSTSTSLMRSMSVSTCNTSNSNNNSNNNNSYNIRASIPDLRLALEKVHVPRNASVFFMESMIRRDATKTKFIMYKQSTTEAHPIFCAEKYPPSDGGQILIKSVGSHHDGTSMSDAIATMTTTATPTIMGSLMKKKKQQQGGITTTTYELILHEPATTHKTKTTPLVVETIEYEQVGRARYFLQGGRPRCARVTIRGAGGACAETKEPSKSSSGQKVLDFGGRGRETSSKNTQLVRSSSSQGNSNSNNNNNNDSDSDEGGCCLQMVKWRDNEFNLDFGPPFDAFRAFAFALAQFDF